MGELRQNRYVYGPKGDAYLHAHWADPYPTSMGAQLADAAAMAVAWSIDFFWAVAPGPLTSASSTDASQSIQYSSDNDFSRLTSKIENVRALGITHFGLFLDDVAPTLIWPADQAQFSSLAAAHLFLINRLQNYLLTRDSSARLLVVGTAYTSQNVDAVSYNEIIGKGLSPAVDMMWTGPDTYSSAIAASDLWTIDGLLGRRVVLWDNYPTTVIAPTGRAPTLFGAAIGLLSNPVLNENGAHDLGAFWSVLGPLADYEWASDRYNATASFVEFNQTSPCSAY